MKKFLFLVGVLVAGCNPPDRQPLVFSPDPASHAVFLPATPNKYELAQAKTVLIKSDIGQGSGVVVKRSSDDGDRVFVWTANHVVAKANTVLVIRHLRQDGKDAGELVFTARVIARFPDRDCALLWVACPPSSFEEAQWGDTRPLTVGTPIFHVGNFYGEDFEGSVSTGIVSQIGIHPALVGWPWKVADQCSALAVPGSSGGPVFLDSTEEVVGLIVGGPSDQISSFVPVREIERAASEGKVLWAVRGKLCPSDSVLESLVLSNFIAPKLPPIDTKAKKEKK